MGSGKTIQQRLEKNRKRLYDLHAKYGLGHNYVLRQSMVLDELINQYNRIYYAKLKKPIASFIIYFSVHSYRGYISKHF
ncbi:aspartyl-phosphate phosphatase Spo0E family protein [Paenibacillus farraposensis]|nr:aspartyl-phosphate phosphatase Spo0E family protein [Paenibacillus farraposensis]MCC3379610.1 aspartyl-phosphate phosphatase Spo0E family protein [Paenibacillus farraposensis]